MRRYNLVGQKFNKLTVLAEIGKGKNREIQYRCRCDCGNETTLTTSSIRLNRTRSCGCLIVEMTKTRTGQKHQNYSHGMSGKSKRARFYRIYHGIKSRCTDPNIPNWRNYGGRGIENHWSSFEKFKEDMFESYEQHVKDFGESQTSIDRINNDGHYNRENCRWATRKEQFWNSRSLLGMKGKIPWNKGKKLHYQVWNKGLKYA